MSICISNSLFGQEDEDDVVAMLLLLDDGDGAGAVFVPLEAPASRKHPVIANEYFCDLVAKLVASTKILTSSPWDGLVIIRSTVFFESLEVLPLGYLVPELVFMERSTSFIRQFLQPTLPGGSKRRECE